MGFLKLLVSTKLLFPAKKLKMLVIDVLQLKQTITIPVVEWKPLMYTEVNLSEKKEKNQLISDWQHFHIKFQFPNVHHSGKFGWHVSLCE